MYVVLSNIRGKILKIARKIMLEIASLEVKKKNVMLNQPVLVEYIVRVSPIRGVQQS